MHVMAADLELFCTNEREAEEQAWRELLGKSLLAILDAGLGAEFRIETPTMLRPVDFEHRFREGEKVTLLSGDVSLESIYAASIRGAAQIFVGSLWDDGSLELDSRIPADLQRQATLFVLPSGPLTDYYDWQISIVQRWLRDAVRTQSSSFATLLSAEPANIPSRVSAVSPTKWALQDGGQLRLIQGPPGCGKTHASAEIILAAVNSGLSVGVFTFTNRACDEVLRTFASRFPTDANKAVRITRPALLSQALKDCGVRISKEIAPSPGRVCFGTLYKLTKWVHEWLASGEPPPRFDLVLVDEASQATLPMICAPAACAEKLVLMGDQRQLPPLIHTKPDGELPVELHDSAFAFAARRQPFMFMDKTFRMRPSVCAVPSRTFYDGLLISDISTHKPVWPVSLADQLLAEEPGIQAIVLPKTCNGRLTSQAEAAIVGKLIQMWESEMQGVLQHKSTNGRARYLVSCFYRAQVCLVRRTLSEMGIDSSLVHVDTVERNQGQTCAVAFLSIGETGDGTHGLEWSLDPRRLNVAITRARLKSYVLAAPEYVELAAGESNIHSDSRSAWQMLISKAF